MHVHHYNIGAIEVSITTMLKGDHSKSEEVYVCGFVPSYLLPKKRPNSLDPFLHPLVEEVEELFINGNSFCAIMHVYACLKASLVSVVIIVNHYIAHYSALLLFCYNVILSHNVMLMKFVCIDRN